MNDNGLPRSLCLTEEEAMGLLDIVMLSPGELTSEQRAAIMKLSEFCRQFLRDPIDSPTLKRNLVGRQAVSCAA